MSSKELFIRRSELDDAPSITRINSLIPEADNFMPANDPIDIIERTLLSITLQDAAGEVVGFIAFTDHPEHPVDVDSRSWEKWVQADYPSQGITTLNSMFVHTFVVLPQCGSDAMFLALRTCFLAVPDLDFILLSTPNASKGFVDRINGSKCFTLLNATNESSTALFCCPQRAVLSKMSARAARSEDYDDLTPIFDRQSKVLSERYGPFYLAQLIEKQDKENKCFIYLSDDKAAGFASVTSKVDHASLSKLYDLSQFNNLHTVRLVEKIEEVVEPKPADTRQSVDHHDGKHAPRTSKLRESRDISSAKAHVVKEPSSTNVAEKKTIKRVEEVSNPSVLSIGLCCFDEEHELRGGALLEHIFAAYPSHDYIIISMPSNVPPLPFLQYFTRAAPRGGAGLHELYVIHRYSLFRDITVREGRKEDEALVDHLLLGVSNGAIVSGDFKKATGSEQDGTSVFAHVVESCGSLVGVLVFRAADQEVSRLRAHYALEDYVVFGQFAYSENAVMHHYVLNPAFGRHSKFIMREAMRQMGRVNIFYRVVHHEDAASSTFPPSSLTPFLDKMIPLRPRRQIVYPLEKLLGNAPSARLRDTSLPYSLLFINSKLLLDPKVSVNTRVVVVGASDTSLSLIESLIFKSHLLFNNLVLVSTNGLSLSSSTPSSLRALKVPSSKFTPEYLKRISLNTWIDVVSGTMVGIERDRKNLVLSTGERLPYDMLILAPGLQFESCEGFPASPFVKTVNSVSDAEDVKNFVQASLLSPPKDIIVYGGGVHAHAGVEALLQLGVEPARIHLVRPSKEENISQAVDVVLNDLHVHVREATISSVSITNEDVVCTLKGVSETLNGGLLLDYSSKAASHVNCKAMNDACLVFDGRLVVDHQFLTNDKSIYAAGPFTKYSRKYGAEGYRHELFSSIDVGQHLSERVLAEMDPLASSSSVAALKDVPSFSSPRIEHALFPGSTQFYRVLAPPVFPPYNQADRKVMFTQQKIEQPDAPPRYQSFRLALDPFRRVDEIACLTPGGDVFSNLGALFGLHEKYLNNLVVRYDEGNIKDFFDFFSDAWAMAVVHDRFKEFTTSLNALVRENPGIDLIALDAAVWKMCLLDTETVDAKKREEEMALCKSELKGLLEPPHVAKLIKDKLLIFLGYNSYHLPMFARPGVAVVN